MIHPTTALKLAVRGLSRDRASVLTAVFSLGLGMAGVVTVLGLVQGTLSPLPVPDGEEIVRIEVRDARGDPVPSTPRMLEAWGRPGSPLSGVGAFRTRQVTLMAPDGFATRVSGASVTPGVFALLRVSPSRGRTLRAGPDERSSVVVSHELWRDALQGRADVLGTVIRLGGEPHTVVGVMPEGFGFPFNQGVWTLLDPSSPAELAGGETVARLPGGDEGRASSRLSSHTPAPPPGAGLTGDDPAAGPLRVRVSSFVGDRGESAENAAMAGLSVLVFLLLLICAANTSTLLLVRATERAGTLAVHAALGARRAQIVLQLFLEAAVVAVGGGLVGLVGGWGLLSWTEAALSGHWGYYWMRMEVRPETLAWTFVVVVGAALVAGTAPALRALRTDLRSVLGRVGRGTSSRESALGRWFVGAQVSLSTAGLVAALFLATGVLRSGGQLDRLPLDRVALGSISLEDAGLTPEEARDLAVKIERDLAARPGVEAASVSVGVPGFLARPAEIEVQGRPVEPEAESPRSYWMAGGPGLFETFGLRVLRGRALASSDTRGAPAVAVVTRDFASRWLPADPLGARIRVGSVHDDGDWAEVVGVVEDPVEPRSGLRGDRIVLPLQQVDPGVLDLAVRSVESDGAILIPTLREAASRAAPELAVEIRGTLRDFFRYRSRLPRAMGSFGTLGGLIGVLVAAIGLHGVVAFGVRLRLREIGLRMAVGAGRGRILREVVEAGMRRLLPGLAVGAVLGLVVAPVLSSVIPGLGPMRYLAVPAVVVAMMAVGAAASLGPALRASRLDPLRVLSSD